MRSQDQVQRAHDIFIASMLRELPVGTDDEQARHAMASTLCWALEHDHNAYFADTLAGLEAAAAQLGGQLHDHGGAPMHQDAPPDTPDETPQLNVVQDGGGVHVHDRDGNLIAEIRWFAKVQTRLGELVQYPPPDLHPDCQCRGQPGRAFFCGTGHMTECHYPHGCDSARCMHLLRYDQAEAE